MASTADNNMHSGGIPEEESLRGGALIRRKRIIEFGRDTAALLAAIPGMLGFIPTHSMVLLGLSSPRQGHVRASSSSKGSEVGPVVRAELLDNAVQTAVDVVVQALRRRERKEVLIVVIGGDATVLVAEACRRFRIANVHVSAAFVVAEMCAGAPWWEIPTREEKAEVVGDSRLWPGGALPDPQRSIVLRTGSTQCGAQGIELMEQRRFDELLDPISPSESIVRALPESWRDSPLGEPFVESSGVTKDGGQGKRTTNYWTHMKVPPQCREVVDVCALVDMMRCTLEKSRSRESLNTLVLDLLRRPERASHIAHICDNAELYPVLVALALGPGSTAVSTLLMNTAQLARGPLRHRALALLSIVAWCNTRGVLAHRAAHRAVAETMHSSRPPRATGDERQHAIAADRVELTVSLAGYVLSAVELGAVPSEVCDLLDKGMASIEDVRASVTAGIAGGAEQIKALLDQVANRDNFRLMRSELESRAGK